MKNINGAAMISTSRKRKTKDSGGVPLQVGDVIEDDQANQMVNGQSGLSNL